MREAAGAHDRATEPARTRREAGRAVPAAALAIAALPPSPPGARARPGRRERRQAEGGHHRRADHAASRPTSAATGSTSRHRPRGHELPHLRARRRASPSCSSQADVVFVNGLKLEEPTKELAEANLKDGAEIVELGTRTIPESEYIYDFSFPEDGRQAQPAPVDRPAAAPSATPRSSATTLAERDPANADYYAAQLRARSRRRSTSSTGPCAPRSPRSRPRSASCSPTTTPTPTSPRTTAGRSSARSRSSDFEDPTPKEVADLIDQVEAEERAGDLRLRGVPQPGARADRQGDRRRVRGRPARRRPARRARRRRALVARADAVRLRHHDRGARRRRARRCEAVDGRRRRPRRRRSYPQ